MQTTTTRYARPNETPTIVPALVPSQYDGERGQWKADVVLVTPSGHRHAVGYVDPTGSCRRVFEGPVLPGPYAYAFGLATAITANPAMSTAAEIQRNLAAGKEFTVADGDVIRLGWELFAVRIVRRQYIELDHIGSKL